MKKIKHEIRDFLDILREIFGEANIVGKVLLSIVLILGATIFIIVLPAIIFIGLIILLDYLVEKYKYLLIKKEFRENNTDSGDLSDAEQTTGDNS